jgi:SPP1 gp7 family putative phage head morphogenesis protein
MDILNRDELERRLARIVGRDLRSELNRLMDLLGDPPRLRNVPNDYWQNGWRDIQKDVEPVLLDIFLMQAEGLMAEIGIGASWDLVNTTASQWARQHTEQVLQELFNTRYDHLNEIIPRFYEEGWNLGQLRTDLERYYSPVRAEMIAVTETTRAAVEGERALVEALQKESGIRMVPTWITKNDERVCPICGPKHGKEITDNVFPPAHPRCRCSVGWDFAKDNR